MFIFFVQTKKTNQKKIALLVKNSSINFVLKTKIHKLTSFRHMNFLRFVQCINHKLFFNAGLFLFLVLFLCYEKLVYCKIININYFKSIIFKLNLSSFFRNTLKYIHHKSCNCFISIFFWEFFNI